MDEEQIVDSAEQPQPQEEQAGTITPAKPRHKIYSLNIIGQIKDIATHV